MIIIGITGGSGSGKSTVSSVFCNLGADAIDADDVYHKLLNSSAPLMREISKRFPEALGDNGKICRKKLAKMVFSDRALLDDLNTITHKYVVEEIEKRIADLYEKSAEYICIDAIALFETPIGGMCNVTVGVIAPRSARISRITERDGIDVMSASARINSQPSDDFYREKCDFIINNDGDMEAVKKAADEIFNQITKGTDYNE